MALTSRIVSRPVSPASDGKPGDWKVMTIVGTSPKQAVPAAPKVNVSGRVVEVVEVVVDAGAVVVVWTSVVGDTVVVVGAAVDVVVPIEVVVVVPGSHASGKVVERVTLSAPSVYVIVTGPVPADAG